MGVGSIDIAGSLVCRSCRRDTFHAMPGTAYPVEFEMGKESLRAKEKLCSSASCLLEELLWNKRYFKWKLQCHGLYE